MRFKKLKAAVLSTLLLSGSAFANTTVEISSNGKDYNEFLIDQPFVDALFSSKTVTQGNVVVLNNNQNFMFKIKEEVKEPFQLFMVLRDGSRKKFTLVPNKDIPGQTWPAQGAGERTEIDKTTFTESPEKNYFIELLKEVYETRSPDGEEKSPPAGFAVEEAEDLAYYGPVVVREIKRMSNTIYRISIYALSSAAPVPVTPADFYREDVIAVELNNDIVGPDEITMVVISKLDEEA